MHCSRTSQGGCVRHRQRDKLYSCIVEPWFLARDAACFTLPTWPTRLEGSFWFTIHGPSNCSARLAGVFPPDGATASPSPSVGTGALSKLFRKIPKRERSGGRSRHDASHVCVCVCVCASPSLRQAVWKMWSFCGKRQGKAANGLTNYLFNITAPRYNYNIQKRS